MSQHGEASVEEILESIKKVIARDNRVGALEERRRRETQGVVELPATRKPTMFSNWATTTWSKIPIRLAMNR